MTILSAVELTQLRQRPHQTRLWLSIYRPKTRFSASVVTGANDGSDVYYNNVTTGSYLNIQPNSTVLVGTTPGAWDVGKARVRSATGTYLKVSINDDIPWNGGQYLTVLDLHEVFPRYISFDESVIDSDDDSLLYMDDDIAYTNQNSVLGTLVCMGGNYAGFVEDSVYYSSSGTYNVKGEAISAYEWWFEGATVTGSTSADPGYISYPSPGNFITRLKVTSASGGVDYGYRHVSMYNRSNKQPIRNWGMESLTGSRSEGGYNASIWVREILPDLLDNSIVVIFADEEYYGGDKVSIGGNNRNRQKIVFSGYINKDSIAYDYKTSMTNFEVSSVTEIMKEMEITPYSLDSSTNPTKWQHLLSMNLKKIVWEYFKWFSTVGEVADVRYIGADGAVEFFDPGASSIYDSLNEFLQSCEYAQMVADRQGTIFIEPGINITHNATGVYPVGHDLQKVDWIGEPAFNIAQSSPVSYFELGGYYFSGLDSADSIPYKANAPGDIKKHYGKIDNGEEGLIVANQAELNQKTGDAFAFVNAKYQEVSFRLAGNYRNFDIAPYEQVLVTLNKEDTHRQIVLSKHPFYIETLDWTYEPKDGSLLSDMSLHEITHSTADGQTMEIPQTGDENFGYMPAFPTFDFPNFCGSTLNNTQSNIVITNPELPLCEGDTTGELNGYWNTGIRGVKLESNDATTFRIPYSFWYRGSSYDHPTTYTITGKWYKRDTTSIPAGQWVEDLDDTWYEIYLSDNLGNRIGQAVKDPVIGNGQQRTGKFNVAQGLQISSLEIVLNPESSPITSIDWSPFTIHSGHTMSTKAIPGGIEITDEVQRGYSAGMYSGFENGSIWTPRAGGGYPYNKLFDVEFLSYGLGRIFGTYPPDFSRWARYRIGVGTNTDYVTLVDLNYILDNYINGGYVRKDLTVYKSEWLPTYPGNNYLTVRTGFIHSGGAWNADVITATRVTILAKASHKLVIDGFLLWNICHGGHA